MVSFARLAAAHSPELPVHARRQRVLRLDRRLFRRRATPRSCFRCWRCWWPSTWRCRSPSGARARGKVVESLDTVYLLALPVVAALTAQALAPSRAMLAAVQLWWYRGHLARRSGVACTASGAKAWLQHAIIGLLMLGCGLAARVPRSALGAAVGLGIAVIALVLAARRLAIAATAGISRRTGPGARGDSHDQRAGAGDRQHACS